MMSFRTAAAIRLNGTKLLAAAVRIAAALAQHENNH